MGTSGSYGGSGTQRWQNARQRLNDVISQPGSAESGIGSLWESIADALISDDPTLIEPRPDDPGATPPIDDLPELLLPSARPLVGAALRPRRRGRSGAGESGGGGRVSGRASGSRSSAGGRRSRRQIASGAQRGGLAIGSAYALRRGDADALRELGLNLAELQAMSPRAQQAALLDATIGETTHPDDHALKRAALGFLKQVLVAEDEPSPIELIRDFVSHYLENVAFIELMGQLNAGEVDQGVALRKEREIRDWIRARLRRENFGISGPVVALREFQRVAARLAATALTILKPA